MAETILFFEPWDAYGWMSCLSPHPIEMDGKVWATAEHWYQAQKYDDAAVREEIRAAATGHDAKAVSRKHKYQQRQGWDAVKVDVLRRAVAAKFTQHADLAAQLRATGDAELVEHATDDDFWGDGPDGLGENWCGRVLMDVRGKL